MKKLVQRLKKNMSAVILVLVVSGLAGFGLPFLVSSMVYGVPLGSWRDARLVNTAEGMPTPTLDKFARGTVEIDFWLAATPVIQPTRQPPTATDTAVPTRTPFPTRIEPTATRRVIESKWTKRPTDEPQPTRPPATKPPKPTGTVGAPILPSTNAVFAPTVTPQAFQANLMSQGRASAALQVHASSADSSFSGLFQGILYKLWSFVGRSLY
ncbi:MAG: hypothetical protein ACM3QS_00975 [Bacteroidota bacterium]